MILVLALTVGVLYAVGVYLVLQRMLTRIVLGIALMGHGANLLLLLAGGGPGDAPIVGEGAGVEGFADPLPQALALTAIVITFATLAFLLALAFLSWTLNRSDAVQDDLEDRRIAHLSEEEREREDVA